MEDTNVTGENQTVETETTAPSTGEEQTAPSVETSEADTSVQPAEEDKTPRAQQRIQELSKQKKELQEQAEYWQGLANSKPQPSNVDSSTGEVTLDDIVNKLDERLTTREIERQRVQAEKALKQDAADTLEAYPELGDNDDLANAVFGLAQAKGITMKSAANTLLGQLKHTAIKSTADANLKSSSAMPQGSKGSTGELPPINLDSMTEAEKRANWDRITSSYANR